MNKRGVLLADLHIEDSSIEVCIDIAMQAIDLAASISPSCRVILMGDIFTERKEQSFGSLMAFFHILNYASEKVVEIVAFAGNHDKLDQNVDDSYLDIYAGHSSLRLIREPELIDEWSIAGKTYQISCAPYYDDALYLEKLSKYTSGLSAEVVNILLTHVGIDGARNNDGHRIKSNISAAKFNHFSRVYTGHYHDKSKIGSRLIYVGSCRQAWFNETVDKGFSIIRSDGELDFVQSHFMKYIEVDVPLEGNYARAIDKAVAKLIDEHPDDMKRIRLVGDTASIRSVDIPRIKQMGVLVSTKDTSDGSVVEDNSNGSEEFKYLEFDETAIAELFMEFTEEEGISEKDVEYGVSVLGRIIEQNKQ